ncbi:MAG TPA: hypothetical protein VGH27_01620 [Streptosporangiaceae bacterium]|jgi:hypothetical protein
MVSKAAAGRKPLDDELRAGVNAVLVRHCGLNATTKAGLAEELVTLVRGHAGDVQAQALADIAASVSELVGLVRTHLGAEAPKAGRRT